MTYVIAHRGASMVERENTLAAFGRAASMGADGVELDARRTADGVVVVHHSVQLADGRAVVDTDHGDVPDYVPTLTAALDACDGMFVNIEIKNLPAEPDFDADERVATAVMAELATRPDGHDRWLISCFHMDTVDACRSIDPAVPTALLTVDFDATVIERTVRHGHVAVHPWEPTVTAELIDTAHASGLRVNTWTCNDPARATELGRWGIDGICTDVPDQVLAALGRRRSPPGV